MTHIKIGMAVVALLTVFAAVLCNAYHILLLTAGVVFLPLAALWYVRYAASCLTVSLSSIHKTVTPGETATLQLNLKNCGYLPISTLKIDFTCKNGFYPESETISLTTAVGSTAFRCLPVSLTSTHTGKLQVHIINVTVLDPVGLFHRNIPLQAEQTVFVLPPLESAMDFDWTKPQENADETVFAKERPGYDSSETFGLRPYREGDMLRQIHWKLSARTENLIVREFSLPIQDNFVLFADFCIPTMTPNTLNGVDRMMQDLFSLSASLTAQSVCHSISWFDCHSGTVHRQRVTCMDDLYLAMQEMVGAELYVGNSLGTEQCPHDTLFFSPVKPFCGEERSIA